jgi:hypothetical protein
MSPGTDNAAFYYLSISAWSEAHQCVAAAPESTGDLPDQVNFMTDQSPIGQQFNLQMFYISLDLGNNLKSFPYYHIPGTGLGDSFLPDVTALASRSISVPDFITRATESGCQISFILGQGIGSFSTDGQDMNNGYTGNLNTMHNTTGYWINTSNTCELQLYGISVCDVVNQYNQQLNYGNQLIAQPPFTGAPVLEVFTDLTFFALGQGIGLFNTDDGIEGNFNNFTAGDGMWYNISSSDYEIIWDCRASTAYVTQVSSFDTEGE